MAIDRTLLGNRAEGEEISAEDWNELVEATAALEEGTVGVVRTVSIGDGPSVAADAAGNVRLDMEKVVVDDELDTESANAVSNRAVAMPDRHHPWAA